MRVTSPHPAHQSISSYTGTKRGGPHVQVSPQIRARIVALTRTTSSAKTGLSHWSCCELAAYLKRAEGVTVSWSYVAKI